jgi:hypothetical protein
MVPCGVVAQPLRDAETATQDKNNRRVLMSHLSPRDKEYYPIAKLREFLGQSESDTDPPPVTRIVLPVVLIANLLSCQPRRNVPECTLVARFDLRLSFFRSKASLRPLGVVRRKIAA